VTKDPYRPAPIQSARVAGNRLEQRIVRLRGAWKRLRSSVGCRRARHVAAVKVMLSVALVGCASLRPPQTVILRPGDDVARVAANAPAGSTFVLTAGVYRLQSIVPRDGQSFLGQPGTVLDGSIVLAKWRRDGAHWVADGLPEPLFKSGYCVDKKNMLCLFREDLFVNGRLMKRVGSRGALGPGRWYAEARRAYISFDPRGKTVELSVAPFAFAGNAERVTIRDITVQKYAVRAQLGAIDGDKGRDWRVINVTVRWNHGSGLRIGRGMRVEGGRYIDNGQLGIGGVGDDVVIDGVEIARNNYAGYDYGWEAGGFKFVQSANLVVRNSCIHHNFGSGLWGDWDNVGTLIETTGSSPTRGSASSTKHRGAPSFAAT
jgi:hypothetical protein